MKLSEIFEILLAEEVERIANMEGMGTIFKNVLSRILDSHNESEE